MTVEKTPEKIAPDTGAPDTGVPDAGNKPKVIMPQDEAWVDAELTDPFLNIMNNFGTMEFSTSTGAQAYLDYQLEKAGLEVKITSTGMEVADAGTEDPA